MQLDDDARYLAVRARDSRFDGVFYTAVRTTGIYCRPSCPARTPRRANVVFHPSAAAAQAAGFRACKRCLPDATPGSPEWDLAGDAAGRAMRLIADGVVEREGVTGLAARLGYSPRQLTRLLVAAYGTGPLALARARRAQTARVLVETSDLSLTDVAYAAGFGSVRQFNDTVREVYDATPAQLRGRAHRPAGVGARAGSITTRVAMRRPFAAAELLHFLELHAVAGVEASGPGWYERTLRLPHGPGVVRLELRSEEVRCRFTLTDVRDLGPATERVRRLLDADADPRAVDEQLGADPDLAPLVRRRPGLRVPGSPDGDEAAVRTVLGQQVSLAAARTHAARLVARYGEPVALGDHAVTRLFPSAPCLAGLDPGTLPMPAARGRALVGLARALAQGRVVLDRSLDREEAAARLQSLPGIGPWTSGGVALRALGDPDVFLPTDLGVRRAANRLGIDLGDPARWRPWRSYALMHLWAEVLAPMPARHQGGPAGPPEKPENPDPEKTERPEGPQETETT